MKNSLLPTIASFLLVVNLAHAQSQPTTDWSWTTSPWKDDDKPYATLRKQILLLSRQKKVTVPLVESYKKVSDADPWNPQKQFRFAYAAYVLDRKQPKASVLLANAVQALSSSQLTSLKEPPRAVLAFNFCRLRFILTARDLPFRQLLPAGERILKREPSDYMVKYYVATLLEIDRASEKRRKLGLIQEMIKSHPQDPAPRLLLGDAYESLWFSSWKRSEAQTAIAKYEYIKQLQPPLVQVNGTADKAIARIKRVQARIEKQRPQLASQ